VKKKRRRKVRTKGRDLDRVRRGTGYENWGRETKVHIPVETRSSQAEKNLFGEEVNSTNSRGQGSLQNREKAGTTKGKTKAPAQRGHHIFRIKKYGIRPVCKEKKKN